MHEVNSVDCVIKFAIGMQNDKFELHFAPAWTPMQPAQFSVAVRPDAPPKLLGWARALDRWNATDAGGSFAYPHEAMVAFLKEAERSYISLFDSAEEVEGDGNGFGDDDILGGASTKMTAAGGASVTTSSTDPTRVPQAVRQNTADQLRKAWDTYDADTSRASVAKRRILTEYAKLQEEGFLTSNHPSGVLVELVDGNPFLWHITMTKFTGNLRDDLINHAFAQGIQSPDGSGTPVVLEAVFPSEYPSLPPFVRIVGPIFQEFTGRVAGGALCVPRLMSAGWDPRSRMHKVLQHIKGHLEKYGARVHPASGALDRYPVDTTKECWSYINDREPIPGTQTADEALWSKNLIILSASFARRNILDGAGGTPLHGALLGDGGKQFDGGNKVIMPESLYSTIDAMERERRQGSMLRRDGSGGNSVYGKGALTFQITTPMGLRGFCGVLQCLSPEPNQIIVPDWMMRSMFLDECTAVNVRTAELDKIAGLTLQPCNSDFNEQDVIGATGKGTKMFLTDALTSFNSITRGQTITLGSKHLFDSSKPYTTYNFIVKEVIPNVPAVGLWSGFEADLPCKFDKPLIETAGLPVAATGPAPEGHGGESSKQGDMSSRGGEAKFSSSSSSSSMPMVAGDQVRARFEEQHRKKEKQRVAAKEEVSGLSFIRGYSRESSEGTVKVRVHLGERGGVQEERVLKIKAHPSSRICDLYETVQKLSESIGIWHSNDNNNDGAYRYYLEDRKGRRLPRDGEDGSGNTTFSSLEGKKGKVFRVFQRVTKATECYVVRRLAEKIASSDPRALASIDAGDADAVRRFIRNTQMIRGMLSTSLMGVGAKSDSGASKSNARGGGGGASKTSADLDDKSKAVAELVEHLVPYIQGAADADIAWAPPGGWICTSCDNVNLRQSGPAAKPFGEVVCQHCALKRVYTLEEIADTETWELEHFLTTRGVRATGGSFPTQEQLVRSAVAADPSLVSEIGGVGGASEGCDDMFLGVGGATRKDDAGGAAAVHTIVLPNGDSVGLSRPAIALSGWFFTLRDIASKEELFMITPSFLVDNLGAEIL